MERAQRYTAVAIVLHWAIAAGIILTIPLGFWMHIQAEDGNASVGLFKAYQLHKSIGLTILTLSLVRLAWRLMNPPPPLPEHMPAWEKMVARATHWAFYGLMVGLPLTGWLYVSAGWSIHDDQSLAVPTRWFGLIEVPNLFGLAQQSADVREDAAEAAFTAHWVLAYAAIGLAALHVAAALKHHWFDRDETLAHMVPGIKAPSETAPAPKNPARLAVLGVGFAAITLALIAALVFVFTLDSAGSAPPSTLEITDDAEAPAASTTTEVAPAAPEVQAPSGMPAWTVDREASSIGFSYVYEDESGSNTFNGRFSQWSANIRFDPENLDASAVNVRIQVGSARTGVAIHDNALPTSEWFDASANPTATFRTTRIRARGPGQYEARGDLTIKGRTRSVDLPFTLTIEGDRATMSGNVTIDRRDFGIGEGDGDDLISRDIPLTIRVVATRS
jgi:cytochrome b561/polyisoprenoid-binding protein YceI